MTDLEVCLDWQGKTRFVGRLRRHDGRGRETVTFEYADEWLRAPDAFAVDAELPLGPGVFTPPAGLPMFAALSDSAPDTWGRMLMRRRERQRAETERRTPRMLQETDFLLGVADISRLGALRFRRQGETAFQTPQPDGVPSLLALGDLLRAAERIDHGAPEADDLRLIFAPGSSLGGARPKASILDQHDQLSIAKFPKGTDEYSHERWEAIALDMAAQAGVNVARHQLHAVAGRPVLTSLRFDRQEGQRIPFMSAMAMTQHRDGEQGSYLELVDALTQHGVMPRKDRAELYRRIAFSILTTNVDDHLRNHGFLRLGHTGWTLSPAYDINPVPQDIKAPILTTCIDFDDGTCDIELLRSVAEAFSLSQTDADDIIAGVAVVTSKWRQFAIKRKAPKAEIERMASAFEHVALAEAQALF